MKLNELPLEILVENVFTHMIDFDDHDFGGEILNICLVCSDWSSCFYSASTHGDELFWKVMIKKLPSRMLLNNINNCSGYNNRELFILNSIPFLDFSNSGVSFTGPVGRDALFYSGFVSDCKVILDERQCPMLALHAFVLTDLLEILQNGKEDYLRKVPTSKEYQERRLVNAFDLVGNDLLSGFNRDYARIYYERIFNPFSKYIIERDKRSYPGEFIISQSNRLIKRLKRSVEFVQTENEELDQHYHFIFRKAIYQLLTNRKINEIEISDMVEKSQEELSTESNDIPPILFEKPFPNNFDELELFITQHASLILGNPSCITYPCSCDTISFLLFSNIERGHGFFINIESTS